MTTPIVLRGSKKGKCVICGRVKAVKTTITVKRWPPIFNTQKEMAALAAEELAEWENQPIVHKLCEQGVLKLKPLLAELRDCYEVKGEKTADHHLYMKVYAGCAQGEETGKRVQRHEDAEKFWATVSKRLCKRILKLCVRTHHRAPHAEEKVLQDVMDHAETVGRLRAHLVHAKHLWLHEGGTEDPYKGPAQDLAKELLHLDDAVARLVYWDVKGHQHGDPCPIGSEI